MKKCYKCGAPLDDDALFCTSCGTKQEVGRHCIHCGALIDDDALFCTSCGGRQAPAEVPHSTQPQQDIPVEETPVLEPEIDDEEEEDYDGNRKLYIILACVAVAVVLLMAVWRFALQKDSPEASAAAPIEDVEEAATTEEAATEDVATIDFEDDYESPDEEANAEELEEVMDAVAFSPSEIIEEEGTLGSLEEEETVEASESTDDDEVKVFDIVEQMPEFPGGNDALMNYLSSNIKYPATAEENGIEGRVVCTMTIERNGSVTSVKVVKSVHPALDQEAIRVLRSMPHWIPGKHNGAAVRVKYTIPLTFRLQ